MHTVITECRSVRCVSGDDMLFLLGALTKLSDATISFMSVCQSVRMNKLSCYWKDFLKIDMCVFFETLSRNLKCH